MKWLIPVLSLLCFYSDDVRRILEEDLQNTGFRKIKLQASTWPEPKKFIEVDFYPIRQAAYDILQAGGQFAERPAHYVSEHVYGCE